MERELILNAKNIEQTEAFIEAEKQKMEILFPYIESFATFKFTNEVFNIKRRKVIKKEAALTKTYNRLVPEPFTFIICKN